MVFGFSPNGRQFSYSPIPPAAFNKDFVLDTFDVFTLFGERSGRRDIMDVTQFSSELPPNTHFEAIWSEKSYWINDELIYTPIVFKTSEMIYAGVLPAIIEIGGLWQDELIEALPGEKISVIGFSPDLTRAMYFSPPQHLILWDREKTTVLWEDARFPTTDSTLNIRWSPDSSMVVISRYSVSEEDQYILLMTREGKPKTLIARSDFPNDLKPFTIQWSPNNQYLAMVGFNQVVYIYDAFADRYLFRCPLSSNVYNLVWSPDSKYIAFGGDSSRFDLAPLGIVDIQTGNVTNILPYGIPVGWSGNFLDGP
jgi:WD40 repeat protein